MSDNRYIKATAPASVVGAMLQKTGQVVSYATGDDGDIEAGRLTSFLVLPSNNPFGNTNRFTSTTGTQTYTNRIYIDWSTYDGSTVLGYYKLPTQLLHTWTQAVAWGIALNTGGFTSGWRLPNVSESMNLMNFSLLQKLDYTPISFSFLSQFTSTTSLRSTATAYIINSSSDSPIIEYGKTFTRFTNFACRTFTVTGTTLS
jgi:hypothetical protein